MIRSRVGCPKAQGRLPEAGDVVGAVVDDVGGEQLVESVQLSGAGQVPMQGERFAGRRIAVRSSKPSARRIHL
ncbi:hypothetical protein ACFYS7_24020 [Streptomyces avermitilis]|uniref:hypothetical protein n=1 Tax=Streptomyces avermitilis TaxID=33903 RepID=UPI0036AD44DE